MTLIKGPVEEATMGSHWISTLRIWRWGTHCLWSLAGTTCAAAWQDSQNAKADQTGCAVSATIGANASLPLWKEKGCWGLGSPRTKRLQLPHCHLLCVKADSCKNIPRVFCSLWGFSLKPSVWLDSEEITDFLFPARGAKWKATARTAASFSPLDPLGGDQSKLLPLLYSLAQRAALTHAINS